MHQCIVTAKPTFACGFGGQLASYVLTTDALITNVVNGFGCGSTVKDVLYVAVPPPCQFDHGTLLRQFCVLHRRSCAAVPWNFRPEEL